MSFHIYAGNMKSKGARLLAKELNCKRIRHNNSKFTPGVDKVIINWGSTTLPNSIPNYVPIINHPSHVCLTADKLSFFKMMKDIKLNNKNIIPPFTENKQTAINGIKQDGYKIVCRTILNGHGGKGIIIASEEEELVDAPLYVKYMPKKAEYRVHIFDNKIIDIQEKARKRDRENVNWLIRNHENGFIFKRQGIIVPDIVKETALYCMEHVPLHFGALDVIYNAHNNRAYVLEINSAPGLEGGTVKVYADAIKNFIN